MNLLQARFNFSLRPYRQQNGWLLKNPTNDGQRDYFARKLFINGAKDLRGRGARRDIVKGNAIYCGGKSVPATTGKFSLSATRKGDL